MQPGGTSFRPTPTGGSVRGSTERSASRAERSDSLKPEGVALKNQRSDFAADIAAWGAADGATDL